MRGLRPALAVAVLLAAVDAGARLVDLGPAGLPIRLGAGRVPDAWEPVLVAAAALCVAGLALRRSPWLAWFSVGGAAAIAAVDLIAQVRGALPDAAPASWPGPTALAVGAAVAAAGVCGTLAWNAAAQLAGGTRRRLVAAAIVGGSAAVVAAEAWVGLAAFGPSLGQVGSDPVQPLRSADRLLLAVLGSELVGAAGLIAAVRIRRARARTREAPQGGVGPGSSYSHGPTFAEALVDEFIPGFAARRERAAAAERERIAADLHARVVPELRRAVREASSSDDALAVNLRATLDDVEGLMAERHSVILESFGLVPALEWLAERTEARGPSRVQLDIEGGASSGTAPRDVERAAFRVALLAVDNAIRHAPGAPIAISISASERAFHLDITDAGPGLSGEDADLARRSGHRGLADMAAAARGVDGVLEIVRVGPAPATGTRVSFEWPAR